MSTAPATVNWLDLARDAYSASNTFFDASIRSGIEADLRQFQGQHPSGSKYHGEAGRGRSKLFRPKTRAVIRKNEAIAAEAFFSTTDVVSVSAENDNDPIRMASAAVMQHLLQYRLTKSIPWFQTVVGAYQDAQAVGVVASYQYWEYNEKKKRDRPAIRLVPVENLRFDPGADWADPVGTSPYVIELIPMYLKDVRARMRSPDPKTGEAKWIALEDSVILQAAKQYSDTIRQQREGNRTDSKTQSQATNAFNIVWVHKNIIEVDEVDYCYYTLGEQAMLSKPVPLSELYFHGKRPYVVGCAVIETHKTYPSSVPRLTRDVQAEINEVANSRIDNVKLVLNKRYFAKRNRQVDLRSITRNVPGSVTLMQDTEDVKPVEFSDVTQSSYKEQEVLNLDFDDVSGAFSQSSVQSNRKLNETVGGMNLLSTNANQVAGYQLRTFVETWVEPVLRQVVLLEQYYETNDTLIALAGELAGIAQKFGIDQVTDEMLLGEFTLNVNVGLGATSPVQQVEQFMRGMNALKTVLDGGVLQQYGLKIEEVVKELFGKLGYRDGLRFFDFGDQDPMVQQLRGQVAELQKALEAKMPPELLKATVAKIHAEIAALDPKNKLVLAQAVKTGVEAEFSAMQGAEVVATLPQVAPIADELMRAAGYTVPVPPGVDPNLVPAAAMPQLPAPPTLEDAALADAAALANGQSSAGAAMLPTAAGDTTPNTPLAPMQGGAGLPATAGAGVRDGIETKRFDSVGLADGGLIGVADEARRLEQQNRLLYPEAYGARANVGLSISGFTDSTLLEAGVNPSSGRRLTNAQRQAYDSAIIARNLAGGVPGEALSPAAAPLAGVPQPPVVFDPLLGPGRAVVPPPLELLEPDEGPDEQLLADGGLVGGNYVSVLERGDMGSPAYRAQLESRQALQASHPEQVLFGPMRSIAQAARSAVSAVMPGVRAGVAPAAGRAGVADSIAGAQTDEYVKRMTGALTPDELSYYMRTGQLSPSGQAALLAVERNGGSIIGSRLGPANAHPPANPKQLMQDVDEAAGQAGSLTIGNVIAGGPTASQAFENTVESMRQPRPTNHPRPGYASGGLIDGPGSGTSDSIAAQAGGAPLALSDGEYIIPPHVVAALGEDFFQALLARFHQPVDSQTPAPPEGAAPLDIEPGSFVIPADVVQLLGADFFDRLVAQFSAPPAAPAQ